MRRYFRFGLLAPASLLGVLIATSFHARPQPTENYNTIFPLAKGTYWIYRGPVESVGTDGTIKKDVTWKMEVTETLKRQDIRAAVIKGFPDDLWWYNEKTQRSDNLIVQLFPARFYILSRSQVSPALKALSDETNNLQGLIKGAGMLLEFPLVKGQRYGDTEMVTRTDSFYSWVVSNVRQSRLEGIQGVSSAHDWTIYTISEFTVGSHEEFDFVPGIGITRYMGHHNGTVSGFEMKLVEFQPGNV